MLRDLVSVSMVLVALAGCPGGGGGIGDSCGGNNDCDSALQCLNGRCAARCLRAPQCGDGYRCEEDGTCVAAHGQAGDDCESEGDCAAGLSCRINGPKVNGENRLDASCTAENSTRPAGDVCDIDDDCRNGTCELGHCIDLCQLDRDCPVGFGCATIPRVAANGSLFAGCLPSQGAWTWTIPVSDPSTAILLPVPAGAASAELVMSIDDPSQEVGAESVLDPGGCTRYQVPCPFGPTPNNEPCDKIVAADQLYSVGSDEGDGGGSVCGPAVNRIRHLPGFGLSVLLLPSSRQLEAPGAYQVQVSSFQRDGTHGAAVPHVTAVVRMGTGDALDLHFFFLDLTDHPCVTTANHDALNAATAQADAFSQSGQSFHRDYLESLHTMFGRVNVDVQARTYEDIPDRHDLDSLDVAEVGALLALGRYATGINVFFVRSLSPIGLQAYSPNPGPAGLAGTPESGIVIALDTLCYRDWAAVARLTAHQIARYMGLYHNVEPRDPRDPDGHIWLDPIEDSDASNTNLMYFSEHSGTELTAGQHDVFIRSAVLR